MKLPPLQLKAFESNSQNEAYNIFVNIEDHKDSLSLHYVLVGPLEKLSIPNISGETQYKEKLWEGLCFEIFIKEAKSEKYWEWNFSPSGDWWNMPFEHYRKRIEDHKPPQLKDISIFKDPDNSLKLILESEIPLPPLQRPLHLGLSAVLDHGLDKWSYWALRHSGTKPDFHLADDFILELK